MQPKTDNGNRTASTNVILQIPEVELGRDLGQYWRHDRALGFAKRAMVEGLCPVMPAELDERGMQRQIWDHLCLDLKKFAQDAPESEVADHVRHERFLEALLAFDRFRTTSVSAEPRSVSAEPKEETPPTPFRKTQPTVITTWDRTLLNAATGILQESASSLETGHQFHATAAQFLILLLFRRATGSYFNPRLNNLSTDYMEGLIALNLIKTPHWFAADQDEYRRTIKGWDDIQKAHPDRIARARHSHQASRPATFCFQLTQTGDAYVFKRLLKYNISHDALLEKLAFLEHHSELLQVPEELKRDPEKTEHDQVLKAVNDIRQAS